MIHLHIFVSASPKIEGVGVGGRDQPAVGVHVLQGIRPQMGRLGEQKHHGAPSSDRFHNPADEVGR